MIPLFPAFKKLELTDKAEIDGQTAQFPLYSDFEFGSLWSWNVKEEMEVSRLNGNLVVRFTDYTTGEPFLTFLGAKEVNETAEELLAHSPADKHEATLHLVPEVSAVGLDPNLFKIEESRDHFDYVCDVERHVEYPGDGLHSHRKLLRQFRETHADFERVALDMSRKAVQQEIAHVYTKWNENKGFLTQSEAFAYERFLAAAGSLDHTAVGIRVAGKLVAFHVASLPPGTCANALFDKADIAYRGIYPAIDHVVALDLLERGYTHMNIQQDLGIAGLRKAKLALRPAYLLKKYSVSRA